MLITYVDRFSQACCVFIILQILYAVYIRLTMKLESYNMLNTTEDRNDHTVYIASGACA